MASILRILFVKISRRKHNASEGLKMSVSCECACALILGHEGKKEKKKNINPSFTQQIIGLIDKINYHNYLN